MRTNETFSRVKIDAQLKDAGWNLTDNISVRYESLLPDSTKADYVLCNRHGHSLAVLEAKRASINPVEAENQAKGYAQQLGVPYIFLANGEEVWFWEWETEAHPRQVKTIFSQGDLERRSASRTLKVDPLTIEIDNKIVERPYQHECINALCEEMSIGRRKMLVEMATGTGKTRTAAALIKRLFESHSVNRVLFLVDRITLAKQTEDAFIEHLPDYPCYVLKSGRGLDDAKRITITTLQTMINEYEAFSSGYYDLVFTDECHRSIYGKWSGVLRHFDGTQIGLTATPCVLKDADDLPDVEDGRFIRDTLRFFEVDEPTFRYTIKQAVEDRHLVPYQIYKAKTVKTAAAGGFEVKRDELDWSAMDEQTKQEFEELFGGNDAIIVDPSSLERKFTIPERNRAIAREFREVVENGFTGSDGVRRAPLLNGKTIVFAVTKRHAETLAQILDDVFADKKPDAATRYADFVVSGFGKDDTVDGMMKIKRFKKEDFPKILVSVNMLDTGFDCPEVVNLIFARFTKSAIMYQQMRGRGTRKADHIKKTTFTMFDFVGVTDFHGDDEEEIEGGFVIPQTPTDGPAQPRQLLTLDVDDRIDPSTREWLTLDDQGNFTFTEEHEARATELGVRFQGWLAANDFNSDQLRILKMVESKIKADADTIESWSEGRFRLLLRNHGTIARAHQHFGGPEGLKQIVDSLNDYVFGDGFEHESAKEHAAQQ